MKTAPGVYAPNENVEKLLFEVVEDALRPVVYKKDGTKEIASWAPQPGSQTLFVRTPPATIFECLLEGNRGGGKTAVLIASFLQHVAQGHGAAWRGMILRREYDDLKDVWKKCEELIPVVFPDAKKNWTEKTWTFRDGEVLMLRYAKAHEHFDGWKGQEWPFIAFEELTEQPDDILYKLFMSICRCSKPGVPIMFRATTNPYGRGHAWVKARFQLPLQGDNVMQVIEGEWEKVENDKGVMVDIKRPNRAVIRSKLTENKVLLHAQPDYISQILDAARNDEEKKAWLFGDWNVTAGGMIYDVWHQGRWAVTPEFTAQEIPAGWRIDRAYDHGQSSPFSYGLWAESNGEAIHKGGRSWGRVRGDLFLIREWYGWSGEPKVGLRMASKNIAEGILEREALWGFKGRVKVGVADNELMGPTDGSKTPASEMLKVGVRWNAAKKGPGSRKRGWELLRDRLTWSVPGEEGVREKPGLFVSEGCYQWLRTVPSLSRYDKDLDDIDPKEEDHAADMTRYRLAIESTRLTRKRLGGR